MKPTRRLSRRSFFCQVAGAAVTGGSLAIIASPARALQVTDSDPSDPIGQGRGGGTGITDSDPTDPGGRGRGANAPRTGTGYTDNDPNDPVGGGVRTYERRPQTGITDSDTGQLADPVGSGRGSHDDPWGNRQSERRSGYTGITDSDTGPNADPGGYGGQAAGGGAGRRGSDPSEDCLHAQRRRDELQTEVNRMSSEADIERLRADHARAAALYEQYRRVNEDYSMDILARRDEVARIGQEFDQLYRRAMEGPGSGSIYHDLLQIERRIHFAQEGLTRRRALEAELQSWMQRVADTC